jgi:hypothetical protein
MANLSMKNQGVKGENTACDLREQGLNRISIEKAVVRIDIPVDAGALASVENVLSAVQSAVGASGGGPRVVVKQIIKQIQALRGSKELPLAPDKLAMLEPRLLLAIEEAAINVLVHDLLRISSKTKEQSLDGDERAQEICRKAIKAAAGRSGFVEVYGERRESGEIVLVMRCSQTNYRRKAFEKNWQLATGELSSKSIVKTYGRGTRLIANLFTEHEWCPDAVIFSVPFSKLRGPLA